MAQKRMLNKAISVSEQVAGLSEKAQLFYTWSIAHADDFGLLPTSPKKLKVMVIPYWDILEKSVTELVQELLQSGLWKEIEIFDEKCYCLPKWFEHQELRRDIKPKILANTSAEWEDYENIKSQFRSNPLPFGTERNALKFPSLRLNSPKLPSNAKKENKTKNEFYQGFKYFENPKFSEAYDDFLDMRRKKKKEPTEKAEKMILEKLHTYGVATAIAMLNKSTVNSWTGIFELKNDEAVPPYAEAKKEPDMKCERVKLTPEQIEKGKETVEKMRSRLSKKFST